MNFHLSNKKNLEGCTYDSVDCIYNIESRWKVIKTRAVKHIEIANTSQKARKWQLVIINQGQNKYTS